MSIAKSVKKFQRIVLGTIVAVMALSLALWGFMPGSGNRLTGDAGTIFGNVKVTNQELQELKQKSTCVERLIELHDLGPRLEMGQIFQFMMSEGEEKQKELILRMNGLEAFTRATEEQTLQRAWKHAILLYDARQKGVVVTDEELNSRIESIKKAAELGKETKEISEEERNGRLRHVLAVEPDKLEAATRDALTISKLIDLVTASEFAFYDSIYADQAGKNKSAKVQYCAFDPKKYAPDVTTPSDRDINAWYVRKGEGGKPNYEQEQFKVPDKIYLAFLFADVEEFKKKVDALTEAEIQEYYDKHKNEWPAHPPEKTKDEHGHEHEADKQDPLEPKPLSEVRDKVIDGKKAEKAAILCYVAISDVRKAIAEEQKNAKGDLPVDLFDTLEQRFKDRGQPIKHSISTPLDEKNASAEMTKLIGESEKPETEDKPAWIKWGFDAGRKVGDIFATPPTRTRKESRSGPIRGYAVFRFQRKEKARSKELREARETIVKTMLKEERTKRVREAAKKVEEDVKAHGLAYARQKYSAEFKSTRYFKLDDRDATGIDDMQLSDVIRREASRLRDGAKKIGDVMLLEPGAVKGDKTEWAFVVYLEDEVIQPPDDDERTFNERRRQENEKARRKQRAEYVKAVVEAAAIQDYSGKLKQGVPVNPQ